MVKKGNLFLLIKSLTKGEKRYFRLSHAGGKGQANYLLLFDALDRQDEYDEQKIKKLFKGRKFLDQFHVTKIYLTEQILQSLRNYHSGRSVSAEIQDLLRDISILFSKELYDLCHYKIEKAERMASRYEKQALLCEVLEWKRRLLLARYAGGSEQMNQVLAQEKEAIGKLSTLNIYWEHTLNIFSRFSPGNRAVEKDLREPTTLRARILAHHIAYSTEMMKGNMKEAENAVSDLVRLLEQNPDRIKEDPGPYITALSNKIGLLLTVKRWKDIPALIRKIREAPSKYKFSDQRQFTLRLWLRIFNIEMELYRDTRQVEKGIQLVEEIKTFIAKHEKVLPADYRILFYYQFACVFFMKKNHAEALRWINQILNFNFGDHKVDLQCYARLLNLIIHFELNNIIVLRYAVDSCRRFLKKKKVIGVTETSMVKLFSRLSLCLPEEYTNHFHKTYQELYGTQAPDRKSEAAADYLDFRTWLEEKMV